MSSEEHLQPLDLEKLVAEAYDNALVYRIAAYDAKVAAWRASRTASAPASAAASARRAQSSLADQRAPQRLGVLLRPLCRTYADVDFYAHACGCQPSRGNGRTEPVGKLLDSVLMEAGRYGRLLPLVGAAAQRHPDDPGLHAELDVLHAWEPLYSPEAAEARHVGFGSELPMRPEYLARTLFALAECVRPLSLPAPVAERASRHIEALRGDFALARARPPSELELESGRSVLGERSTWRVLFDRLHALPSAFEGAMPSGEGKLLVELLDCVCTERGRPYFVADAASPVMKRAEALLERALDSLSEAAYAGAVT